MKKNNSYLYEDEIHLGNIIKSLWNEKILILSISLIFMVVGYVYGALQPKIYKTEIIIREAPSSLFKAYSFYQGSQQQQPQGIAIQFNDEVKLNLSSLDTLVQFVEKTNTINDFKNHLKEKNISPRNYFKGKFQSVIDKKNNITNKYSLTYLQPLPVESFLNDYVIFAQQQAWTTFKQQLVQSIINDVNIHQQQLEIAKKIELDYPILKSTPEGQGQSVVNEPRELFYKGTKVITQKITYLNKSLNETQNLTLDYNPILEQASSGSLITKSPIIYATIAFLSGFFLSLLFIFLKNIQKKENIC